MTYLVQEGEEALEVSEGGVALGHVYYVLIHSSYGACTNQNCRNAGMIGGHLVCKQSMSIEYNVQDTIWLKYNSPPQN